MAKKWTYHTSHSFKDKDGNQHSFMTQLYKVGVYGILDGKSEYQGNYTPNQIVTIERKARKQEQKGEISDLVFGREITVSTDDHGLYVEVQ